MDLKTAQDLEAKPTVQKIRPLQICAGLLLALFALFLVSATQLGGALARAREGTASSLIAQLSQAAKAYQLDYTVYPQGDGSGTKDLVISLQKRSAKQTVYFEFPRDPMMLTPAGDILNPVLEGKIIYYRCPGIHNPKSFDLWCEDSKGKRDGINNWE